MGQSNPTRQSKSQRIPKLRGIRKRKWGRWVSEMRMPASRGKLWLGTYDTAEQAARAYDFAVYCFRGPHAKFNFPLSPPEMPSASSFSQQEIRTAAANFALQRFPPAPGVSMAEGVSEVGSSCGEETSSENEVVFWESVLNGNDSRSELLELTHLAFPPSPVQQHGGIILDQIEWWEYLQNGNTLKQLL